jgi:hypothetical protein
MIRINDCKSKISLKAAVLVSAFLLFAVATGFGQQVVNLTAGPATTTMPDGTTLPMWGYSCQALAAGATSTATCAPLTGSTSAAATGALGGLYVLNGGSGYTSAPTVTITPATGNTPTTTAVATAVVSNGQVVGFNLTSHGAGYTAAPTVTLSGGAGAGATAAAAPAWSPVEITVPYGAIGGLQINLTNNLSFAGANLPTSIVIVGQVGGGLGGTPTTTPSPSHATAQGCPSWFIAAQPPGTPCTSPMPGASGTPPVQGPRLQSMGTEVAAVAAGTTSTPASLTWANLRPGTYLLESGTHPSIQVPMGLIGMLVVTTTPSGTTAGTAYPAVAATTKTAAVPAVPYNAELPLEFSEIDPVQNKSVDQAVRTSGFSETTVWSGLTGACGNPASSNYHTCYPPAVNYTPFYFLINGLAFDKANPAPSLFAATAGVSGTPPAPVTTGISATGTVLLRLVNAGLRMHVPAVVGSQTTGFTGAGASATVGGFTLIAEDGNPLPTSNGTTVAPRVKTEVFMAAGKTYDVMVNVPAIPTGATVAPSLPVYDRELSLSANSSVRDAGMLAYIGVNGSLLPITAGTGAFATPTANPDTYDSVIACATAPCIPLIITDPSKGVIANDVNVYGVALSTPPAGGTLTCSAVPGSPVGGICANGTFTYTPNPGTTTDSFGYCANGGTTACTTVALGASTLAGSPTAINQIYTSKMATFIKIPSPGLLLGNMDPNSLPLSVASSSLTACGATITAPCGMVDPNGGFTLAIPTPSAVPTTPTTETFTYTVQNSQGSKSVASASAAGTVTVTFPVPSNLQVHVLDAQAYSNCNGSSSCISALATTSSFPDYRWIIEEDKTFWVNPNCTTNSSISTPGCPSVVGPAGQSTIPTFGVNFHTSNMDFVAQGCTGPLSCEGGQTMLDTRPACTAAGVPAGCSATAGQHIPAVCDVGNGACRPDPNQTTGSGSTPVLPSQVVLDPAKRYYISVLPGDAGSPFPGYLGQPVCPSNGGEYTAVTTNGTCGHTMSGAPIPPACNILGGANACTTSSAFAAVNVLVLPTPLPTGKLSVIVFEDDYPLNGEQDGGGGNGTVAPIEPGLGGFNLVLWDTFGGLGDVTGQDTYDDFNQPLSNSLDGSIDPVTGLNACPITAQGSTNPTGITGMIVTCPKYESDNTTLSPLAGQAIIANLMPEKFSVQAYPGASRIAAGEQWIQTNTLDGQHPHDSFIRIGEPSYFQEYGPAGYHVNIGFANPAIINARHTDVCNGAGSPGAVGPCTNIIDGQVDVERLSRTPDQRLYPSGSRAALAWTQCWVSLGDPDGEDFQFTFCDANGNFTFTNVPGGNWRLTVGDQWNDQIIDGLSTPANVGCTSTAPNQPINATACPGGQTLHMGSIGTQQWQSNLYTRTFIDDNKDGIWESNEIGIPFIYTMIRYRDGHNANSLVTDFNGIANFNEEYPLFNWYVVEADSGRYKTTGVHTVYDAGGPADGSPSCSSTARGCGTSTAYSFLTNSFETIPLPSDLSVPGAVYCAKADCTNEATSFAAGTPIKSSPTASTGRIDPPIFGGTEGWSGLTGQSNWIDIGKAPYASCPPACATVTSTAPGATTPTTTQVGENGGIHGQVAYASTRPFDDASQMIQQPWEPNVPHVTLNLYQEGFAVDGVTPTLTLVDTTQSSSWDDWAQGFYPNYTDTASGTPLPYMSCPGQGTATNGAPNQDLFFFTLYDQPNYLDWYNTTYNGGTLHTLPYNSQFKCYDAMHIGNQLQPAVYDGKYSFPSVLGIDPTSGKLLSATGCVGNAPGTACPTASGGGVTVSSMAGTNCTVCVANPDTTDKYRVGTPMLPPGKYVVQVIMPPGYEVYKEEDKNLLIGDNFIAPVTNEFGGLGTDIFILPDQASVASMYDESNSGINPSNYQDQTSGLGLSDELSGVPGFPGFQDPLWPCVGEMRVVPDYLSLFPQTHETAPFAGATRPLCDRKEVTLQNQMAVSAKFYIFTSTHIASKYAGGITDDYTSEFDPFAPQFGEKFSPPNLPVSTKDYLGNELSRVYSDHWGTYDGLTFSSWEVNPPNITGYSPTMLVQCMNDPGPVVDSNPSSPTYGQLITDPLYNPAYSDFCYEDPYMPGLTTYLDTPVVPTEGFVGAAYNSPDCSYPDTTPGIKEVDGSGIGPWVSAAGASLTITSIGNTTTSNSAYAGPSANVAPFNQKTVTRHYGFGAAQGTGSVTIGGIKAAVTSWNDTQITVTVPAGVPNCAKQQQAQYGGSTAQCGQLVITAGSGKQSIDAVTVTIGGKAPTHIAPTGSIQSAINAAAPGDLLMVDPNCTTVATTTTPAAPAACSVAGLDAATPTLSSAAAVHNEMLLMWKPVRLQGVGAVSSILDVSAFPAGKLLDPWRRHVNCLFGMTLNGVPSVGNGTGGATVPYDPTGVYSCPDAGWNYYTTPGTLNVPQIDRLPLEAVVGWDATVNGNIAEQLQEPSLMGAYEGAGITVLGKGVWVSASDNIWTDGSEPGGFPADALLLQDVPVGPDDEGLALGPQVSYCFTLNPTTGASTTTELSPNPYPSNYECNPSSIDGITIRDSSQGGGGIFVHGWAHNLQIANNRINNNAGTLSGGVTVGQGEFPIALTIVDQEGTSGPAAALGEFVPDNPPSCVETLVLGLHLPYCLDLNVNVHNNNITGNSSLGDELFSGTLAGGGGATFCTGSDYYKFNYNWVCGNVSSAEGGGVAHIGFIYDGDIEHNSIILNQSTNPTIPTNGGGLIVMGTPDTDPICGTQIDADCPPGLSDGSGPGLVVNANLIQANAAESGSGGGIRLQQVSGTDVSTFPTGCITSTGQLGTCPRTGGTPASTYWNSVSLTNNIVVNNMAGWDGAGISLDDSLNVSITNNTVASNDSLATSGVLTQSIGTPESSAPAGSCVNAAGTASCPQSAGVTSELNSPVLTTTFTGLTITCPAGMPNCTTFSNPILQNNIIWQNRSFYIGIGNLGQGNLNQQKLVSLFSANGSAAPVQTAYGQCNTGVSYWDLGLRGDTGPTNHSGGGTLNPTYSLITSTTGYASTNKATAPGFVSQYCNGSRQPPTCSVADGCGGPSGYGVPPGIVDASSPNPVFSLTPSATVDEGNNWINVSWGPLSVSDDSVLGADGNFGGGNPFANYAPAAAMDTIPVAQPHPALDFFGNPRPDSGNKTAFDPGAIEVQGTGTGGGGTTTATVSPSPLAFGSHNDGTSTILNLTVANTGTSALAGGTFTFGGGTPQPFTRVTTGTFPAGAPNCGAGLAVGASCTIKVQFAPTTAVAFSRTLTVTYTGATVTGSPVTLTGTGVAVGTLTFTSATNGTLGTVLGVRTLTFTIPTSRAAVTSVVTITNSGAGSLQITADAIAMGSQFSIAGTTCSFTTPLAPAGTCTVSIHYATPTTRPVLPNVGLETETNTGSGTTGGVTGLALDAQ